MKTASIIVLIVVILAIVVFVFVWNKRETITKNAIAEII